MEEEVKFEGAAEEKQEEEELKQDLFDQEKLEKVSEE
jgi:hypothetical protein